jgi:hypothetical protein
LGHYLAEPPRLRRARLGMWLDIVDDNLQPLVEQLAKPRLEQAISASVTGTSSGATLNRKISNSR